jgi:membrane carboxypeptidase/penicillin-binding protein
VYGIGEASQFYFQKTPSELSLNECLYLARLFQVKKSSCISLTIKDVERFCCKTRIVLTNIMFRRGLLTPEDTIYKSLPILISGPARSFIKFKVQDSTQVKVDSLAVEDEFDL